MKLSINQRLTKIVKDYLKLDQQIVASIIGIKPNTFSNYLTGETRTPAEVFEQIKINYPQINSDWLLLGEGEMLKETINPLNKNDNPEFFLGNAGNIVNHSELKESEVKYNGASSLLEKKIAALEAEIERLKFENAKLIGKLELYAEMNK